MRYIYIILIAFAGVSCINHEDRKIDNSNQSQNENTENIQVNIENASGFTLEYKEQSILLSIFDPRNNSVIEKWELVNRFEHKGELKDNQIPIPINNVIGLSTTHYPFFKALQQQEVIKGIVNSAYSKDQELLAKVKEGEIKDITSAGALDQELAIELSPEIVMVYPFGDSDYSLLENAQIPVLNITEYLELSPLAKLEWIKLFGVLLGEEKKALAYYDSIKNEYNTIIEQINTDGISENPCTFLNLPFKRTWNLPSGNSFANNLLKAAQYDYLYADISSEGNLTYEVEKVLEDAENCEKWIIIGFLPDGLSYNQLEEGLPSVKALTSFQNQNILVCNTAEVDFFGQALLEPHILLKDIAKWRFPKMYENYNPKYFKPLK